MKSIIVGIVVVLAGIGMVHAGENIPLSQVPPNVLEAVDAAKDRLAKCYKKYGYSDAFLKHPYIASRSQSVAYQQDVYLLNADENYEFRALPDGQVIGFANETTGKGIFNQPTKPAWSKEKLAKTGQDFLEALLGHPLKGRGAPYFYYMKSSQLYAKSPQGSTQYSPGYWSVGWNRIDEKTQIAFETDNFSCAIFEGDGPSNVGFTLSSDFSGVDFTPVKEEDALPEAVAASKKMVQWKTLNGWFDGGSLDEKPYRSLLRIVQPNHWGSQEVTSIYAHPDRKARLVWEFWFPWYPDGMIHDPTKPIPRGVAVYIDAQTKEWIGGDAGSQ